MAISAGLCVTVLLWFQIEGHVITIAGLGRPSDLRDNYNKGPDGRGIAALTVPPG